MRTGSVGAARPCQLGQCVGTVGGGAEASQRATLLLQDAGFRVQEYRPEPALALILLILDDTPEPERAGKARMLAEAHPDAGVLAIMPTRVTNASLRRILIAGVAGIVFEADVERALVPTACAILAGQLTVPIALSRQVAPRPLSYREKQIVALVMRGRTNREIAAELYLAESTVKTHLSSAFRKLDARSRSEAIARIIDPEGGYGSSILEMANDSLAAVS
jgi:DNA-binding NarL/FixJ family response regulator